MTKDLLEKSSFNRTLSEEIALPAVRRNSQLPALAGAAFGPTEAPDLQLHVLLRATYTCCEISAAPLSFAREFHLTTQQSVSYLPLQPLHHSSVPRRHHLTLTSSFGDSGRPPQFLCRIHMTGNLKLPTSPAAGGGRARATATDEQGRESR